jgi:arginyl-tRNA synthetase
MLAEEVISDITKKAFTELFGFEPAQIKIEHPQNRLWGDYSTNVALAAAKSLNKAPSAIAGEVLHRLLTLDLREYFDRISVDGPGFINFTLSKEYLLSRLLSVLKESDSFGSSDIGEGRKIALEHSNVNPNKAAHIGHLRNAVIGQYLEHVYEFIGYDVEVQYYSNDLGVQVSTSLLGIEKLGWVFDAAKYDKFDHYAWDVYAKISEMLDADLQLKKELDNIIVKLDNRDPEVSLKQSELSKKILKDNLGTFAALDIDYDLIVYESSIKDMHMWEKTFDILKKNSKVYFATEGVSKGCWLVKMAAKDSCGNNKGATKPDLEEDKIIVRSNGVPTYTGKDIAYHMWKYGLLDCDFRYNVVPTDTQNKSLYETSAYGEPNDTFGSADIVMDVIDSKQTYAIDVVKQTLGYLGYEKQSDNFIHVNYGHVYLSANTALNMGLLNEKGGLKQIAMSGRKGVGVKVDDFTLMVDESLKSRFGDFPNAVDVRNSVIKFDMLRYDTFQNIVFDVESALSLKGFTGPYVQYTHARAHSLLDKAGYTVESDTLEDTVSRFSKLEIDSSAQEVLKLIYKFPEVVMYSALQYAPNQMCVYLYELCQKYNSFYNDSPILNAETPDIRDFRLFLTAATKQVVKNGLYLLGIRAVDRM